MHNQQLKGFFMGVGTTALAVFGILGLSGFQATSPKMGVVDFKKAFNESGLVKSQDETLRAAERSRRSVIEYISTYPTITREQATQLRTLSVKRDITEAERTTLDKLKATIQAEEKKSRDLQTKANPTQEDLKAMEGYRTRVQSTRELIQAWAQEFNNEMIALQADARQDLAGKIRNVIAEVGRKEGYSVIYDIETAPYAANDVTKQVQDAAAKAAN